MARDDSRGDAMNKPLLFVGGPCDGRRIVITEGCPTIELPIIGESAAVYGLKWRPTARGLVNALMSVKRTKYQRETITADGEFMEIMRCSEITCADALRLMIQRYPQSREASCHE